VPIPELAALAAKIRRLAAPSGPDLLRTELAAIADAPEALISGLIPPAVAGAV
jgi:hypothetical protein